MKCATCSSSWEVNRAMSRGMTACPFCGANITNETEKTFFNKSKDALMFIADTYGSDVLLGKQIVNYFPDLAPSLKDEKDLIRVVAKSGALEVLKSNLQASQSEKEIAVKQAVSKLPAYMDKTVVETLIREFAIALGWQLSSFVQVSYEQPQQGLIINHTSAKIEDNDRFSIILVDAGNEYIKVVKTVKDLCGFGIREAKHTVDSAPRVLKTMVSKREAESLSDALRMVGARIRVESEAQQATITQQMQDVKYDVILKSAGYEKIRVVKAVKDLCGLGLKESKDTVDFAPSVLAKGIPKDYAETLAESFKKVGAIVEVSPS